MKVSAAGIVFGYTGEPVLSAVSFELPAAAISVVIGPSGSGKSTLLQLLAGLLQPAAGAILFDGGDVAGVPTEKRDVGVVFQSYALFPHLSVRDNIAFGLRGARRRLRRPALASRVEETADLLGLASLLDRRPAALSGGEQQRVALARAVAPRPALLLLDEPLSALDAPLRRQVRVELAALLRRLGTTVFYVTHDQEEALLLADHLIVLDRGRVAQSGPPMELYRRPASAFVASFLGEANLLPTGSSGPGSLAGQGVPGGFPALAGLEGMQAPGLGWLVVRPEDLAPRDGGTPATVVESRGLGPYDRVVLQLPEGIELLAHLPAGSAPLPGTVLPIAVRAGGVHFVPARER